MLKQDHKKNRFHSVGTLTPNGHKTKSNGKSALASASHQVFSDRTPTYFETNPDPNTLTDPLAGLIAVSQNLVSLEAEPLLALILNQLRSVVGYSGAVVARVEDSKLRPVVGLESIGEAELTESPLCQRVVEERVPVIINLQLSMTSTLLANGQTAETAANLRELKQIVNETYTDVREEIFNLRAKAFSGLGFLEMLHKYTAKYRRYYDLNIRLVLEVPDSVLEFPADVGRQMIRVIQEALINVRKHAQVSQAQIRLRQETDRIGISVEDQGQGFDLSQFAVQPDNSSFGLEIMRERAESIGGELVIESCPGTGTTITLWVPPPRSD